MSKVNGNKSSKLLKAFCGQCECVREFLSQAAMMPGTRLVTCSECGNKTRIAWHALNALSMLSDGKKD